MTLKGKAVPAYAIKAYGGGDWRYSYSFLIFEVDGGGGEWLTSRPGRITPVKEHRYPLKRRLDGTQRRSARLAEEKSLAATGIWTPNRLEPLIFVIFAVPNLI